MKLFTTGNFGVFGMVAIIAIWIAAIGGYIANIVKLIGLLDGGVSAWLVARSVGAIAAPLGSILGWF